MAADNCVLPNNDPPTESIVLEWAAAREHDPSITANVLDEEGGHVELSISEDPQEDDSGQWPQIKVEVLEPTTLDSEHCLSLSDSVSQGFRFSPAKKKVQKKAFRKGFIPFTDGDGAFFDTNIRARRNGKGKTGKVSFQKFRSKKSTSRHIMKAKINRLEMKSELEEDCLYPVKIAARKELNRHHFDNFYLENNNKFLSEEAESIDGQIIKRECNDLPEDSFVELCEVKDEAGCQSVQLEYGSGVSIYESVEAYDSDNESRNKTAIDDMFLLKTESSSYKCSKCPEEFTTKAVLMEHKAAMHKRKTPLYKCRQCSAVYKRAYKFHCHEGGHDARFSCDQCHRTFVRVTGFKKHLRQCHKVANPNVCVVCGQYFTNYDQLDSHLLEEHPAEASSLRAFFKQCVHCRYQFVTQLTYENHMRNAPYKCNKCDMTFECNNKLGFHLNFKHKPQICNHCGKHFTAFDQYTYHVRYYHTDKHIKCPFCEERFRVRSRLLIHIDVNHTEGHNYKCNQCDYTAKNYASVNRHRRIVHMPKSETHKNVCNVCNKSFLVLSRLKVHMKSHSDAKPHVCQKCGRGYKFEYLLKRHQRNPELCLRVLFPNGTRLERKGKRRCDMCDLGFAAPEQLALHMVATHNINIETRETSTGLDIETRDTDGDIDEVDHQTCVDLSDVIQEQDEGEAPLHGQSVLQGRAMLRGGTVLQDGTVLQAGSMLQGRTVLRGGTVQFVPHSSSAVPAAHLVDSLPASHVNNSKFVTGGAHDQRRSLLMEYDDAAENVHLLELPFDKSSQPCDSNNGPITDPIVTIDSAQLMTISSNDIVNSQSQWQAQQYR